MVNKPTFREILQLFLPVIHFKHFAVFTVLRKNALKKKFILIHSTTPPPPLLFQDFVGGNRGYTGKNLGAS